MKVALLLPDFPEGGVETVTLRLAEGLIARGDDVTLVIASRGIDRARLPPALNAVDLGARRTMTALPRLVRWLRDQRPDAVIAAKEHGVLLALIARRIARVPIRVVAVFHQPPIAGRSTMRGVTGRLLPYALRTVIGDAAAVVAVSAGVSQELRAWLPRVRDPVVIPNPVITNALLEDARSDAPHPWLGSGAEPTALFLGRLSPEKDIPTLLRAIAEVRARGTALRLLVAGDGPERSTAADLVGRLELTSVVEFVGLVDRPGAWIAHASLLILTSSFEGLPTVLVEALALGCPVVSTDCPYGPREILDGGRLGRLVPVGDASAVAVAAIDTVASTRPAPLVLEDYTVDVSARRYAEVARC